MQRQQEYEAAFAKELSSKVLFICILCLLNLALVTKSLLEAPWAELDKEEANLLRDPLSGLGCNHDDDDWYGGKVAFIARLRNKIHERGKMGPVSSPGYVLELEPPELGPSTRFARRWGSRRFLRVRIPDDLMYQRDSGRPCDSDSLYIMMTVVLELLSYFSNLFVIHSRVFQPYYAKDHTVFLLEVDHIYTSHCIEPDPDPGKISLHHFLEWHNPMRTNNKQASNG